MRKRFYLLIFYFGTFIIFACDQAINKEAYTSNCKPIIDSIYRIEMRLSSFGVESDYCPSINADIDFVNNTSTCKKWFDNPQFKDTSYSLSVPEMKTVLKILENSDLKRLKKEYRVELSDQPTSTITIFTKKQKFIIMDYGLNGENPLPTLYKIVYKL
jgi:hypothetical protein